MAASKSSDPAWLELVGIPRTKAAFVSSRRRNLNSNHYRQLANLLLVTLRKRREPGVENEGKRQEEKEIRIFW